MTISPLVQLPNTYRAFYGSFSALRPFQHDVIAPILHGHDLILQAATGSGKTEAVLAPCLERVIASGRTQAVLYVVPTRALVHDLRRRVEPLMRERLGLVLGMRTGDVKRLPAGQADLLLTTPESLDVMLGSSNREVREFLQRVRMLVVDEVHQLVQGYRGRHLAYLLRRLDQRSRQRVQKIALSATLAGPEAIRAGLALQADAVWISHGVQRQIQPHLVHVKREPDELVAFIDDLARRFGARKLLLFANSRSRCDQLFGWLRQRGYFQATTYLHYSNLKPRQRQDVERQFQRRAQALCIATSTLELGIDVGDVDSVILYEPPESVTTFLQRLGRANRQSRRTTFWGICRGPRAGEQLLQFLALCDLAQRGAVETLHPVNLPSVLVQQVLSTLYEHKRVELQTLQGLFAAQADVLAALIPTLEAWQWLRRVEQNGQQVRWRGGWRYARALRAHQIWSNFPETEEPYILEVEAQAVADLPPSIVRQFELGDQVELTGRCLQIVDIQDDTRKVVRAIPVQTPQAKALYWIGAGAPVSWQVAQAVRALLQPDYVLPHALAQGLFSRTRMLLQQHQQRTARCVVLHNGIELSRTPHGFYRYATYLGSVGNFILQRSIEEVYGAQISEFSCTADAIAVECSDRIDLRRLPLPVTQEAMRQWAAQHLPAVRALFAFNAFARALPRQLLLDEATAWLWDERVAQAFSLYRQQSSEIAAGDATHLEWHETSEEQTPPVSAFLQQGPHPSLLQQEKTRLGLTSATAPVLPAVPTMHRQPRALTGTMVGTYMQHQQCDRLLSFDLLPYDQQPPKRALVDSAVGAIRAEQGKRFEQQVLDCLAQQGTRLYRIPEQDTTGRRLTLHERQERSFAALDDFIQAVRHAPPACAPGTLLGILVQPVLMVPALIGRDTAVDGVGIPDLIEVTYETSTVCLTICDIKDSAAPRYSQKWQVAFYAALLQRCVLDTTFPVALRLGDRGVLWTRPPAPGAAPARHAFDLAPYLETFPVLQDHVNRLLDIPLADAAWQLQTHCASCAYLDTCYRQSLSTDDVMLLPHVTAGEHLKLRTAGLHTLAQAADWARQDTAPLQVPMRAQQATRLRASIRALVDNRVELLSATTSLFPANISTVLFVHIARDPRNGQPHAWGLQRLVASETAATTHCWVAHSQADLGSCREAFVATLRHDWQEGITPSSGPHLVTFGQGSWHLLRQGVGDTTNPTALDFLWQGDLPRHTDLRQLVQQHFALPIPLRFTLAHVARVWGLTPALAWPPDFLQDESEELDELFLHDRLSTTQLEHYMHTHLELLQQVWRICTAHVQSDWHQSAWQMSAGEPTLESDCVTFLERQQHWRQRDILATQQLPLAERVERYRALGPLAFERVTLDAEGRFMAHFQLPAEGLSTRFRPGDFLKLNPLGSPDLQAGAGVILAQYDPQSQRLAVIPRQTRPHLTSRLRYVLDEDLEDWTTPRVLHAVREALNPGKHPHLTALLQGTLPFQHAAPGLAWAQRWLQQVQLNPRQCEALLLPFHSRLGLIEGPPGTGKTYLLACMLIALLSEAAQAGRPLRLVVTALTHQAIDNVLVKVQQLLQEAIGQQFPGWCVKWGRRLALTDAPDDRELTYVDSAEEVLQVSHVILGATGFGLYQLFDSQSGSFPAFFDWVVVDEASQMLLPQALLSLLYGKGQYIFCGDVRQLPPVVRGPQAMDGEAMPERSILAHLLGVYDTSVRVRLNQTYRLNRELCQLPSRLWYEGDLHPAAANAEARLSIPQVLHPDALDAMLEAQRPATLVLVEHTTEEQQSVLEADLIARLAARLLLDYGVDAARLAILAPHRAQNNAIRQRLAQLLASRGCAEPPALPVIDTVERLQGAERDVVLFSLTTSDPDHLESAFLNNPNRFNVAITRARHKLIVVGSRALFTRVPRSEAGLLAHQCFTAYYRQCDAQQTLFELPSPLCHHLNCRGAPVP